MIASIFEELPPVDPAHRIVGERLNFWVASLLAPLATAWLARIQLGAGELPPRRAKRQGGSSCPMR